MSLLPLYSPRPPTYSPSFSCPPSISLLPTLHFSMTNLHLFSPPSTPSPPHPLPLSSQASPLLQLSQTPRTRQLFMAGSHRAGGGFQAGSAGLSSLFGFESSRAPLPSQREEEEKFLPPSPRVNPPPPSPAGAKSGPFIPKLQIGGAPPTTAQPTSGANVHPSGGGGALVPKLKGLGLNLGAAQMNEASERQGGLKLGLEEREEEGEKEPSEGQLMLMQEVAILQMQAEGWKGEWSLAMQENERLRMAMFETQSALEAMPNEGGKEPPSSEAQQVGG